MNNRNTKPLTESPSSSTPEISPMQPSALAVGHPVLTRLIEEVRNDGHIEASYDRVHNRHNRGR